MKVYLVRHAKTKAHEKNQTQRPDSSLSKTGIKQANLAAERIKNIKIDVVISSKWQRAKETAEIISEKIGKKLTLYEGIHEKKHHPELYKTEPKTELVKKYQKDLKNFGRDLDWKFEGQGESLRELSGRSISFKKYLESQKKGKNILVITHGYFIRAFLITSLLGNNFDDKTFANLFERMDPQYTGITLLEYLPERKIWKLIYYNDYSHLHP